MERDVSSEQIADELREPDAEARLLTVDAGALGAHDQDRARGSPMK
jgi:hypothetical protein